MNQTAPDPDTKGEWAKFFDDFQIFLRWVLAGLIDAAFIVLWVYVQYWVNEMTATKQLAGLDQWQLDTFKLIFAVSTLAAIAVKTIGDIFELIIGLWMRILKILQKAGIINMPQASQAVSLVNSNPGTSTPTTPATNPSNPPQQGKK